MICSSASSFRPVFTSVWNLARSSSMPFSEIGSATRIFMICESDANLRCCRTIHKMKVKLYTRKWCGWCVDAKDYLKAHGIAFEEVDVGKDPAADEEMQRLSGQPYVPTIVVDGKVLANFDERQLEEFLNGQRGV